MKDQILGNVFSWDLFEIWGLLPTESLTTSIFSGHLAISFLPGLGVSAFFFWCCGWKFEYPTVNFTFLCIIIKLNFLRNFAFRFEIFFVSCSRLCNQGLIVFKVYYFKIWTKKEHNLIISRVISSHMGPMYIETPCKIWIQTSWIALKNWTSCRIVA